MAVVGWGRAHDYRVLSKSDQLNCGRIEERIEEQSLPRESHCLEWTGSVLLHQDYDVCVMHLVHC